MNAWRAVCACAFVLTCGTSAFGQDAVKADPSHYKVLIDNPSVRVMKVSYAPGAKSTTHSHPDAVVVALSAAKARFTTDGKPQDSDLAAGAAMYTPATTHSVENVGKSAVDAILVEFKGAAPGKATIPTSRPGLTTKTLAEGAHAVAYATTADATFHEAAGAKHDFDQVVIALAPGQLSLSLDGKPAKTTWARGDAVFIGRGVAHEAKNTAGKPVDMVIVAIK
jgi:quercetin dioxygenase-like cupin family protein